MPNILNLSSPAATPTGSRADAAPIAPIAPIGGATALPPLRPIPALQPVDDSADALLRRAASENPAAAALLPVVLHTIGRGLARRGAAPQSDLDLLFDAVMSRHPGAPTDALRGFVDGYAALPASSRAAVEPAALRALNASEPLAARTVLQGLRSLAASPADKAVRSGVIAWRNLPTDPVGPLLPASALHFSADALRLPRNIPRFGDPTPVVKTVAIVGTHEEGATLTVRGAAFATGPGACQFLFAQQQADGQYHAVGSLTPASLSMQKAVIVLPPLYGQKVADTAPPVNFQITVVRSAAANTFEGMPTQSPAFGFALPHRMKAEQPAVVAGPSIRSLEKGSIHGGETLLVQVDNIGQARVLDHGMHANLPVVPGSWYGESVTSLRAYLTRVDGQDDDSWGSSCECKLIKPSGIDGSPGQVEVRVPASQLPGDYHLQLCYSAGISLTPVTYQGAQGAAGLATDEWPLQVLPYHYTGRFNKLQLQCKGGKDPSGHNLNTFNVFTAVANGIAYTGQSAVSRIDLKNYTDTIDPQVFSAQEATTLKDGGGGGVAMYGPLTVAMAAYNFTPGSDNQATLDAIKAGSAIAAEVAVGVAGAFGGAGAAGAAQKVADEVKKVLDFVLGLFHKTSPAKASLDAAGGTTIDYLDLVVASQNPANGHIGKIDLPMGQMAAYGAVLQFNGEFQWRRDEP